MVFRKMYWLLLCVCFLMACRQSEQPVMTQVSLFASSDSVQVCEIVSEKSNMYREVGHHGPAVENEFFGLRLYFNNSGSVDVYSKSKAQLELHETLWYPDSSMQVGGYGSDQYKVGNTVGLGGIKLWDGNAIVDLMATKGRTARVAKSDSSASMEMIGYGIPYQNRLVDIQIKTTVYAGDRIARVEARSLDGTAVQFVTGINYHSGQTLIEEEGYVIAYGVHPEDVAIRSDKIGAAFLYDQKQFEERQTLDTQVVFISKPAEQVSHRITTCSEHDAVLGDLPVFEEFVKSKLMK